MNAMLAPIRAMTLSPSTSQATGIECCAGMAGSKQDRGLPPIDGARPELLAIRADRTPRMREQPPSYTRPPQEAISYPRHIRGTATGRPNDSPDDLRQKRQKRQERNKRQGAGRSHQP